MFHKMGENAKFVAMLGYMAFMGIWIWIALPILAFAVSDLVASDRSSLGIAWIVTSAIYVALYKTVGPLND
jgi:hypothetical protein